MMMSGQVLSKENQVVMEMVEISSMHACTLPYLCVSMYTICVRMFMSTYMTVDLVLFTCLCCACLNGLQAS